ncbi:sensor histidine kinase [Hwanghaeella grinnelliae]|nr:HAMP domain-containing sensor histidine kinase [Hwanghaeella grinnelliae]
MRRSAPESDYEQNILERARWRLFVDGLRWAMAGTLGGGLTIAIAIASVTEFVLPASWFAAIALVTALRAISVKQSAKPAILSRNPARARAILYAGTVASGLAWGAGSLWLIVVDQQLIVSVLLSFCAAGMTAAAAASFSAVTWGFTCFVLPYLTLLVLGLVLADHDAHIGMALAVLVFTIGMLGISRALAKRIKSALALWLVNKRLYRKTVAALAAAHRATTLATERERTEMEAKAASEAKTQFLATMSHELRTPLNAIVGFSNAMQHEIFGPLAPEYRDYATHINESGTVLNDLVGDLLELSRIELGHQSLERHAIPVADLFSDVGKMFQETPDRPLPQLRFDIIPPDLTVEGDRRMLWQVLINLVGNAVKFSPKDSTIFVDAAIAPADHAVGDVGTDTKVRIRVRDSGIGIAQEDLGRITQAFVRGTGSAVLTQDGVGLGLSLVKAFVDLHDGELLIESRPNQGTTVTVLLPVTL